MVGKSWKLIKAKEYGIGVKIHRKARWNIQLNLINNAGNSLKSPTDDIGIGDNVDLEANGEVHENGFDVLVNHWKTY